MSPGSLAVYHEGAVQNVSLSSPVPKASSTPAEFSAIGDRLYFVADDGSHGREVWLSDGTADGTRRASDLLPGLSSAHPQEFTAVGQQVFFSASTPGEGRELWTMTADGESKLVRDIVTGDGDSNPSELTAWNGQLAFTVNESGQSSVLWMSDGTENGTRPLLDSSQGELLHNSRIAGVHDNRLFVFAESTASENWLWRFDSLADLPVPVAPVAPEATLQVIGDRLYFSGFDPRTGYEPWISDGTANGSRQLADVNQNTFGSDPQSVSILDGIAYFTADEGHGRSVWQSDGTIDGTRTVRSLIPDLSDSETTEVFTGKDALYLTQSGDAGAELWKVEPGIAKAELWWRDTEQLQLDTSLGVTDDQWFFTVHQADTGSELWVSDGTAEGTRMVRDVNPGAGSSSIEDWTPFKDGHLFVAENPKHGKELWFTSGTEVTTNLISDIRSGSDGSLVGPIHVAGDYVLFSASDGTLGNEPWISDGTIEGTRMLANIDDRTRGSDPSWLTVAGDQVFFVASDELGEHLWLWAPTMREPEKVSTEVQRPSELVAAGNLIYFSGFQPDSGLELWTSDGSSAGTRLISDVVPGIESSAPKSISVTDRGDLFFSAVDAAHGREAWWLPVLDGDTNADGDVDIEDFLILAQHFGQSGTESEGDFNQDGFVDFRDFLILAANFGRKA